MAGFWQRTGMFSGYKSIRQVNRRDFRLLANNESAFHVICDIDKTYLETKFETVLQLIQTALQPPERKQTVVGATDVLKFARWGDPWSLDLDGLPTGLHFVSSSPPQMRAALEIKLSADGLDWDSDTFKDQAYNLLKGKVGLLRNHAAYKTLAIFRILQQVSKDSEVFLIGDNAELDPYIYAGVYHYLSGNFMMQDYIEYIRYALPEGHLLDEIKDAVHPRPSCKVAGVLIRKAPGYQSVLQSPLTDTVFMFDDYFQASLILLAKGLIPPTCLRPLVFRFHNIHGIPMAKLQGEISGLLTATGISSALGTEASALLPELAEVRDAAAPIPTTLHWNHHPDITIADAKELLKSAKNWLSQRERIRESR